MKFAHTRKSGFTFIEALLGVFLITSIIVYCLSSFLVGRYTTKLSRERLVVSDRLKGEMEALLGNYSGIPEVDPPVNSYITVSDGMRDFQATRTFGCKTLDDTIYGLKKVYTKITWLGGLSGNTALTEEMVMYVTRKE